MADNKKPIIQINTTYLTSFPGILQMIEIVSLLSHTHRFIAARIRIKSKYEYVLGAWHRLHQDHDGRAEWPFL